MWNKLKYWYAQFFSAGAAAQAPLIPVETLRYAEKEGELLHPDWYVPVSYPHLHLPPTNKSEHPVCRDPVQTEKE